MGEVDLVRAVKEYRRQHKCSLQEAIDAVRGPKPERVMTDKDSPLGMVEQAMASLLVRTPDMSGDQRRRLRDDQYRSVQSVAREVHAILSGGEASGDQRGSNGTRAATVSHEFREGQKSPTPQELEEAKADLQGFVGQDAILPGLKRSISRALSSLKAAEARAERAEAEAAAWKADAATAHLKNQELRASLLEAVGALRDANEALTMFTAFEDDARYIMGNTNFSIVQMRLAAVKAAITRLSSSLEGGEG